MIVRLCAIARPVTFIAATWLLALVFLSFAAVHIWAPPYLVWIIIAGVLMQVSPRMILRTTPRP